MTIERGPESAQHLRIGDQVPLSVHYFKEGAETLNTICGSTIGNNPTAGTVIAYLIDDETAARLGGIDKGRLVRARCNSCEFEEDIGTLRGGKSFKSGTYNPLIPE